jgi:predicted secreted protein
MTLVAHLERAQASPVGAVLVGVAAAVGAAVLMQLSAVWLALVSVGLLVFAGSFVARDAKVYWLSIFLAAVPLNITKLFFWSPEDVALIKQTFGIYINENLVPQMYLADLPLAMLLLIWCGEIIARRQRIEVPRPLLMMAGFLVWAVGSVMQERAPLLGISWLVYEIKLAVMFLWFVNARLDRRAVRHALAVLLLSLVVQSGITFYTYIAQTGENVFGSLFGASQSSQEARVGPARGSGAAFVFEQGALRRGTGTIGTANLEAKYFVLLLPLALVGAACAVRPPARIAAGTALVAGLAALYLTYSRGGLLCALLSLALVPVLLARSGWWSRKALATTAVAAVAAVMVASPFLLSFLGSRPGFSRTRLDQTLYGLELWWNTPIAGVGINNFNLAVSPLAYDGTFAGSPIHNHYLRIAIETGAIGAVLYFGFFLWATRLAYRLTAASDQFVAAVAAGLCAALIGNAVYWVEDLFYDPIIRMQTWICVALVAVLARLAPLNNPLGPLTIAADERRRGSAN